MVVVVVVYLVLRPLAETSPRVATSYPSLRYHAGPGRFAPSVATLASVSARVVKVLIFTFLAGFGAPGLPIPSWAKVVLMVGIYLIVLWYLNGNSVFERTLPPNAKLAIASGIISFWIMLAPLMTYAKKNPQPLVIAILMVIFLIKMQKRIRERTLLGIE